MVQVYVDDATGQVTQAWTGFQVAWTMARGYPGAFGRRVNALVRLDAAVPAVRRAVPALAPAQARIGGPGGALVAVHLDLLDAARLLDLAGVLQPRKIGLSVPLVYPFMLYLLVRMLLLAFGGACRASRCALLVPHLAGVGIVFLVGFRIGLNVTNSNVIDVGYAGVIGADKILHGEKLYGDWPIRQRAAATPTARSTTTPTSRSARSSAGAARGTTCPPPTPPRSPSTC